MAKRQYALEVKGPDAFDQSRRMPLGGWKVYNGRDEGINCQVGGHFFWIPPDLGHTEAKPVYVDHPSKDEPGQHGEALQVPANGILDIDDLIGRAYVKGRPTGTMETILTARDICYFLIKNYGEKGLILLEGTTLDSRLKNNARKQYREAQLEQDKQAVETYKVGLANWQREHPQEIPKPPPEPIRLAMERVDAVESDRRGNFTYECPCGVYASNSFESYARHARINHGKIVTEGETTTTSEVVEPKRRGRPPKVEVPA